eukprot:Selendium_serpulae@DN2915_c0_g1_i3.p1
MRTQKDYVANTSADRQTDRRTDGQGGSEALTRLLRASPVGLLKRALTGRQTDGQADGRRKRSLGHRLTRVCFDKQLTDRQTCQLGEKGKSRVLDCQKWPRQ